MNAHGEMGLIGESYDTGLLGRMRDDEYESRSGSDNFEVSSCDEQDADDNQPQRRKKYHRHTPNQIQELEAFFKECPWSRNIDGSSSGVAAKGECSSMSNEKAKEREKEQEEASGTGNEMTDVQLDLKRHRLDLKRRRWVPDVVLTVH